MKAVYGNSRDTERPDAKFRKIRQRETLAAQSLQRIYRQHVGTCAQPPSQHAHSLQPGVMLTVCVTV